MHQELLEVLRLVNRRKQPREVHCLNEKHLKNKLHHQQQNLLLKHFVTVGQVSIPNRRQGARSLKKERKSEIFA